MKQIIALDAYSPFVPHSLSGAGEFKRSGNAVHGL
jgi:hypothetical protein